MTVHGVSRRSAKRRKIDHPDPHGPSSAPQAVQTFKDAVLGRFSPFGYNAQRPRATTENAFVEDSQGPASSDAGTEPNAMDIDSFANPARDELAHEENDVPETPSKSKRSLQAKNRQLMHEVDTTKDDGGGTIASPSKSKRKKYRAQSRPLQKDASTPDDKLEGEARDHEDHGPSAEGALAVGTGDPPGSEAAAESELGTSDLKVGTEHREAIPGTTGSQRQGEPDDTMKDAVGEDKSDNGDSANHRRGRPSGRKLRKPRKYSTEMAASITLQHTPQASSGPPRGRKKKASAVVTIAEPEDELQFGFKDIPNNLGPLKDVQPIELPQLGFVRPEDAMQVEEPAITTMKKRGNPPKAVSDTPLTPRGPRTFPVDQPVLLDDSRIYANEDYESLRISLKEEGGEESLAALKKHILEGLTGKRRLSLVGLDAEYQKVRQLVEQTVVAGEGNSMLVIGARGTAKTNLVETVLSDLAVLHRDDFYVVRLNGFIHTDDKLALREIWRQLGREMEVEDDTMGFRSNYADTLASLLALLSHPAELADFSTDQAAKSVIFVMDEFDLFTTHPRQTLLYNLFDIAQSRKAPIAVLGLTTRVDVVESLEKRVKSRFSHRYVHLSLPKSFSAFQNICKSTLMVHDTSFGPEVCQENFLPCSPHFSKVQHAWNNYISTLFSHSSPLNPHLLRTYHLTKSIPSFLATSLVPLLSLSPTSIPTSASFLSNPLTPPDSKLHLLCGLSDLSLSLLIAAARLDVILDTDVCNFNMAYDEYQQLASRVKVQSSAAGAVAVGTGSKVWGREVAMGAWERLVDLELVMPAVGTGSGLGVGVGMRVEGGGGGCAGWMWG
ncbi:MAG: origin recognition complex subunit [Lasallia pustulata]|uniref:Origin recognition complex subunit n=1 Tax=Lasallia pustulata TaxID=136370 RepID=A0A5M8PRF4_9LECA|nr:MAG: origin recognition complex subunit [Lasallia pustulata]